MARAHKRRLTLPEIITRFTSACSEIEYRSIAEKVQMTIGRPLSMKRLVFWKFLIAQVRMHKAEGIPYSIEQEIVHDTPHTVETPVGSP